LGLSVKTAITAKVTGKFSIRLVPNMELETVRAQAEKYLNAEFAKLQTTNSIEIVWEHGANPWL
jgi:Cys-Gly metallodipeptidase DUG1